MEPKPGRIDGPRIDRKRSAADDAGDVSKRRPSLVPTPKVPAASRSAVPVMKIPTPKTVSTQPEMLAERLVIQCLYIMCYLITYLLNVYSPDGTTTSRTELQDSLNQGLKT